MNLMVIKLIWCKVTNIFWYLQIISSFFLFFLVYIKKMLYLCTRYGKNSDYR